MENQTSESTAESTPTLEDVYKEYGIEEQAQEFRQQTTQAAPEKQEPVKVPDPITDTDAFNSYQANIAREQASLRQALQHVAGEISRTQKADLAKRTEADIQDAVAKVNKDLGLEPEFVEVAIGAKAHKDPKFQSIWNNRHKNPKALDAALTALSGEFKGKYTVKQDPQLVENQRAAKHSQQSMATTKQSTDDDRWSNMTPNERAAERERIKNSPY